MNINSVYVALHTTVPCNRQNTSLKTGFTGDKSTKVLNSTLINHINLFKYLCATMCHNRTHSEDHACL